MLRGAHARTLARLTPWRRTYWAVFAANLIAAVGMMSFMPFFPALLRDLGVEDAELRMLWAGVLTGAAPLAAALMGPLWGTLGDRLGRKPMLLRALCAIAVFVGAMSLARGPWELLFLRLGQGCFSGFVPPSVTLVSIGVPRESQGRVTGSIQAAMPIGTILGPLVGARLQTLLGFQELFWFVSAAAGTGALLVAVFAHEDPILTGSIERFSPTSVLVGTARDLRRVFANPRIRGSMLALATAQFAVGATSPQLQLFVEELGVVDPERVVALTGWLFTATACAGVLATPLWGWLGDRVGHAGALVSATLATALALCGCSLVPGYAFLLAARSALGFVSPGVGVTSFGLAATETEEAKRGSVFGAVFSARALSLSLGAMAGGFLAREVGIRGLFLLSGAALGLVVLRVTSLGRRRSRLPSAADSPR